MRLKNISYDKRSQNLSSWLILKQWPVMIHFSWIEISRHDIEFRSEKGRNETFIQTFGHELDISSTIFLIEWIQKTCNLMIFQPLCLLFIGMSKIVFFKNSFCVVSVTKTSHCLFLMLHNLTARKSWDVK